MIKTKMLAVLMVSLMMAVSVVPILVEDDEVSAAVGDGETYSYTLNYTSANVPKDQSVNSALSLDGMDAIYHPSYDGTSTTGYGSWTWNTETGIGPFNSFYAAFDMTDGNKMVAVLDPFDLTKKIDGTSLDDMTKYNIMWVLPTVYWKVQAISGGNQVTITNDPTAGGVAYAHTINGQVREYVAYGVYEGTYKQIDDTTVFTSESGKVFNGNWPSLSNLRTYAHNYSMDSSLDASDGTPAYSMIWNYYQWQLYRICSFTVMENFNSQATVGNGYVYSSSGSQRMTQTGNLNTQGPFAGTTGDVTDNSNDADSVKLFIENAWGSALEYVDGLAITNNREWFVDTSDTPQDSTSGEYVSSLGTVYATSRSSSNYTTAMNPSSNASIWAIPGQSNYYQMQVETDVLWYNAGFCDTIDAGTVYNLSNVQVGGGAYESSNNKQWAGINYMSIKKVVDDQGLYFGQGARLSFVYGDVISTITVQDDNSGYGTVSSNGFATSPGAIITIDGNTITCDENTVTATPISSTTTSIYSFDGWYNGLTLIPDGTLEVTGDMTITAHFSQAERLYDVTVTSSNTDYGTVSSALVQVPYNTTIASATNTITLGTTPDATVVTATPTTSDAQYTYAFSSWTGVPVSGYITEAASITANFTQTLNSYTITWVIGETSTTETYDYGEMPTHENPTPPEGYYFAGWNPEIATVTGDQTYTAVFSNMTVTFDPGSGTLQGDASKVVVIGQPIGELPTCTAPTNYMFDGWYTAATGGTKVTEDTIVTQEASFTLYAHYELVPALQPVKAILDVMPILIAVGLILGAVYVFMTRPELATTNNLLYAIVGISVAVLMLAVIVIPIIGNAL